MSLVLAFGLSPLGQVPAYAGDDGLQAQAVADLETQAAEYTFGDCYYKLGGKVKPTLTYTGDTQTIDFFVQDSGGPDITMASSITSRDNAYYTVDVQGPGDKKATELSPTSGVYKIPVKAAGDYKVFVAGTAETVYTDATTGEEYKYTGSKEYTIHVNELDLSTLTYDEDAIEEATSTDQVSYFAQVNALSAYNGADQAVSYAVMKNYNGGTATADTAYAKLAEGTDYTASKTTVNAAGEYTATLKGKGDCTGEATVTFSVSKAQLLKAPGSSADVKDGNAKVNGFDVYSVDANAAGGYKAGVQLADGSAAATAEASDPAEPTTDAELVAVPYNKAVAGNPVELTYEVAGGEKVTLEEGTDYQVAFYSQDSDPTKWNELPDVDTDNPIDKEKLATDPGTKYWAVIDVNDTSDNFFGTADMTNKTPMQRIYALCKVGANSMLESFVDHVVLADGAYAGGTNVPASLSGATFYGKDGSDVTSLVGENFKLLQGKATGADGTGASDYGILSTNTYNSAALSAGNTGVPTGAGQYYTYITGDKNYRQGAGNGIIAYYTVDPKAAVEGEAVGDLKVTVGNATFKDGDYVEPGITVEMYTTKSGATEVIEAIETEEDPSSVTTPKARKNVKGALGQNVVNYKVTYTDAEGNTVTKPSARGAYKATITFSGNLDGTDPITKDFEVSTGDISALAKYIQIGKGTVADPYVDPWLYYTGGTRELDPDDVVFLKADKTKLTDDDLAGAEFTLSYSSKTATVDTGTGLPINTGRYTVTATFTGSYTGTVSNDFYVNKLDMKGASSQIEVQYQQADGSYATDYSTVANSDGSAIVPTVRVAVKDGKERSANPTLVEEAVYTPKFTSNTKAGQAMLALSANAGYTSYVSTDTVKREAFVIAGEGFSDIAAELKLSKSSAKYTGNPVELTLQLDSSKGALAYGKAENAAGLTKGTAEIVLKGVDVYTATSTVTAGNNVAVGDITDNTKVVILNSGKTAALDLARIGVTNIKIGTVGSQETILTDKSMYKNTGCEVTIDAETVYASSDVSPKYYESASGTGATDIVSTKTFGGIAGSATDPTVAFVPDTTASGTTGVNYELKVLDADGKDVTTQTDGNGDPVTVGFDAAAPYTTVKVDNLVEAGEYTIVAYAGSNYAYAGRVTAPFTITGTDISEEGQFSFNWVHPVRVNGATTAVTTPLESSWAVDYDATAAKKVAGITFNGTGTTGNGQVDVAAATGKALVEDTDYKVTYEDNKQAGDAKIVFEGIGNYSGKVEKPFKINQAEIFQYNSTNHSGEGYQIDFDTTSWGKNAKGAKVLSYTGEALTPAFTINYYEGTGSSKELKSVFGEEFDTAWYNNVDVHYGQTGIDDYATVEITAKGNYKGTLVGTFEIDPVTLTEADFASIDPVSYTGNVAQPQVKATYNGKALTQGKDFAVDVAGAKDMGAHTATISQVDGGNFLIASPITKQFTITGLDLSKAKVELDATSFTYNGKAQQPKVESVTVDGAVVSPSLYTPVIPNSVNAGDYTVAVKANGSGVSGTSPSVAYQITKASNGLKVAKATRTAKKVSKKKVTVKGLKVSGANGKVTYTKVSVKKGKKAVKKALAKKFTVNKTSGKITVKKGTKKGTYKVTVSAKAAGDANHNASAAQKAVVTIKVKK